MRVNFIYLLPTGKGGDGGGVGGEKNGGVGGRSEWRGGAKEGVVRVQFAKGEGEGWITGELKIRNGM